MYTLGFVPTEFGDIPMDWLWQDSRHSQGNRETSFAKEVITHTSYMPTKRRDNYTIKFLAKVSLSLSRLGYGLAARFCLWFGIKVVHKNRNSQTTMTRFWLLLTAYPHMLIFSMV